MKESLGVSSSLSMTEISFAPWPPDGRFGVPVSTGQVSGSPAPVLSPVPSEFRISVDPWRYVRFVAFTVIRTHFP